MISKISTNKNNFKRKFFFTKNARSGWSKIIEHYKKDHPNGKILLPAYIGWSPNEGSGIFDSVINANISFDFYSLDKFLQIDFADFKSKVEIAGKPLILLVHYFGLVDTQYDQIVQWLKGEEQYFVEDCAHAMFTDLIGGKCGREGKFSLYSLHKLLPLDTGGILISNRNEKMVTEDYKMVNEKDAENKIDEFNFGFDLWKIANKRKTNYSFLCDFLTNTNGITIIHPILKDGIYPQTLPILIHSEKRDDLYFLLNKKGFGVVSLYHTMIKQLNGYTNEAVTYTSKHILNLPVHQDTGENELKELASLLKSLL
jgi:dTDP-4-amino-4,6-dideoxygalactose transaminase